MLSWGNAGRFERSCMEEGCLFVAGTGSLSTLPVCELCQFHMHVPGTSEQSDTPCSACHTSSRIHTPRKMS
jgi:hypothetical protein